MKRRVSLAAGILGAAVLLTGSVVAMIAAPASAAAGSGLPAVSAAAVTAENQDGVSRAPTGASDLHCADGFFAGIGAYVCFQPYGDLLFVDDTQADGNSAYIYWENWQEDSNGHAVLERFGRCYNRLGAANGWAACDKDFVEDSTSPNAAGGVGSYLKFSACEVNGGCVDSMSVRNYE